MPQHALTAGMDLDLTQDIRAISLDLDRTASCFLKSLEANQSLFLRDRKNSTHTEQELTMSRAVFGKFAVAFIAALSLSACVQSQAPLVTDAQPLLGQQFEVHLYENFVENKASYFHSSVYRWKDGEYHRATGLARDATRFVAQSLAGNDFVIQSTDQDGKLFHYWLGRKLSAGVYLIVPLEEKDADEATRKAICGADLPEGICRVTTRDQLLILARATAAKPARNPALGVVMSRPNLF